MTKQIIIMKLSTIKYIRVIAVTLVLFASCTEEARIPDPIDAANVRIQFLAPTDQLINFADIANAQIKYNIFSKNKDLESVELTFMYNNAATGLAEGPFVLKTYTQDDFDAAGGAIRDEIYTADELAVLVGKTSGADLSGGDNFVFANRTTLTDGRVYPATTVGGNNNITPGIAGNAGIEQFSVGWISYVACPVPATFATGKYTLEQIAGPDDPFFGNPTRFAPGEVTLVASSPIQRDFNVTYLTFTNRVFSMLLVCENYLVNDDAGVGCGPGLRWGTPGTPGSFDDTDDSVLIVEILENVNNDCGIPANEPLTLKLTKVE
jgi:hypothetical protein